MNEKVMARVMDLPIEDAAGELMAPERPVSLIPAADEVGGEVAVIPTQATFGGHLIQISSLEHVKEAALWFLGSGLFPDAKTEMQMRMKILVALELGAFNFHGLRAITVVVDTRSGIPSITVNYSLLAALVNASGRYSFSCTENSDQKCVIEFYDRERLLGRSTYSIDRARVAGLLGKDNWQKNPDQMLYAAAMRNGVRSFCPDLVYLKKFGASIA